MPFEIFTRDYVRTTAPRVTITNLGRINLNNGATSLLRGSAGLGAGAELTVLFLWDRATNRIGIQPTKKDDARSYVLKAYGPKGRSGTGCSAVTFLKYIRYDFSGTQAYSAKIENDMLVFAVDKKLVGGTQPDVVRELAKVRRA